VSDTVFRQIEVRYQEGRELNDACRIGLLKYYASREMLSESESEIAERLLEYYIARNVCFSFYLQFDRRIREKFYLYGRCYVEYHAAPSNHVLINYRTDGETEYHREDLIEVYPGIYVREFILFVGEKVQYYLSEYRNDAWQITESALLCAPDDTPHQGSYGQINEMARALQQGDRASAAQAMQRYQTLQQTSEQAFRLL
jgi:hypothetical protein